MWVQRLVGEWRVALVRNGGDPCDEAVVDVPADDPIDLIELDEVRRFGVRGDETDIAIEPRLADRPVVARPERPFYVPARQQVTMFVGTPLWVALTPSATDHLIEELPLVRPSDTWFGPDTTRGELCYASRTGCRLRFDDVVLRPHRAITEVTINNTARDELLVERLKLPVQHVGLYEADDGVLWTQDVELQRVEGQDLAPLRVKSGAPRAAAGRVCIAPPREHAGENLLVRAFSQLFT